MRNTGQDSIGEYRLNSGPQTILVAHLGGTQGCPEYHQYVAIQMHQPAIEARFGVRLRPVEYQTLDQLDQLLQQDESDVALIMAWWRHPVEALRQVLERSRQARPTRKLVYLDFFAPTGTPHFGLLSVVDRYGKRQVLKDRRTYLQDLKGGGVFPHFLAESCGYDLRGWHFGSIPEEQELGKLVSAWNLGVTPQYRQLTALSGWVPWRWKDRKFDVSLRLGLVQQTVKEEWYETHRRHTQQLLGQLPANVRVTPPGRTRRAVYYWELLNSKIAVSPFGWGEVCFRDYEAVACGCLLVKPSMEHLETAPNIYVPWETYVPVKWDLSDLLPTIETLLRDPTRAQAIAERGRRTLLDYYRKNQLVEDFGRVVGLSAVQP